MTVLKKILFLFVFLFCLAPYRSFGTSCKDVFKFDPQNQTPVRFAEWINENRLERRFSIERLSLEINNWGLSISTNKIWRIEQNLVAEGNRPLRTIDIDLVIALEGIFNKSFLQDHNSKKRIREYSREYFRNKKQIEMEIDQKGPYQIALWVKEQRNVHGHTLITLARRLHQVGYKISENKLYRLEQNLVENGKRPLKKIDYRFYIALKKVLSSSQ